MERKQQKESKKKKKAPLNDTGNALYFSLGPKSLIVVGVDNKQ